jgi:Icc-related predicted phosphoesterase
MKIRAAADIQGRRAFCRSLFKAARPMKAEAMVLAGDLPG